MSKQRQHLIKGSLLLLFAGFLAEKYFSGKIYVYISPRFSWMTLLAIVFLVIMAISFIWTDPEDDEKDSDPFIEHLHDHKTVQWSLIFVCLPLMIGWIIPTNPIGAGQVAIQGVSTDISVPNIDLQNSLTIVPAERNILDWVRTIGAAADPSALNDQEANVIGFVYRDGRFTKEQFMVARFAVSCCVADARAMGLVVETTNASQYTTGVWVQVTGAFKEGVLGSSPISVIQAEKIIPVEQPAQPYLYP